jgi:hypothetical protein
MIALGCPGAIAGHFRQRRGVGAVLLGQHCGLFLDWGSSCTSLSHFPQKAYNAR